MLNQKIYLLVLFLLAIHCQVWAQQIFMQKGIASFYADHFQGRVTANGDRYDKNELTAAHKTLAFGSVVRVTNELTQKSVLVRINDRGPYVKGRIIDLSRKAAESIELIHSGTAKVIIELIEGEGEVVEVSETDTFEEELISNKLMVPGMYRINGESAPLRGYTVQVAAFNVLPNAIRFVYTLEKLGFQDIRVQVAEGNVFRILTGDFKNRHGAEKTLQKLKKEGYDGIIRNRIK